MLADGVEGIADIHVLRHQAGVLGPVASRPTVWRNLDEITPSLLEKIQTSRSRVRRHLCPLLADSQGVPTRRIADTDLVEAGCAGCRRNRGRRPDTASLFTAAAALATEGRPRTVTQHEPKLSVVIPHYGKSSPTRDLVAEVQNLSPVSTQIIVSDDCSPEPYPDDPTITVVRRPRNSGFGSAVNSGAELATGEWLMILNSDLTISDHFLTDWLDAARPWGDAVTAPRVVDPRGAESWSGRHFPTIGHQFIEWLVPLARWRHLRPLHEAVGHDTRATGDATQVVDWVMGAALLMPTKVFREVGGFDEDFHMNAEEVDLQRRLRDRGIPSIYLGEVTAEHEGGGSSDPQKRRRWLVTSRLRYADKWAADGYPGGRRSLIAALTVASVINLLWNTGRRALRRDVAPWATFRYEMSLLRGEG